MTSPTWQPDPAGDAYTLIHGEIRCRVWRTQDTWSAIVSQRGDATAAYNFKTTEAAQAWCDRLVRERQRR